MNHRWVMPERGRAWSYVEGTDEQIESHIQAMVNEYGTVLSCVEPGVGGVQEHKPAVESVVAPNYAGFSEQVRAVMEERGINELYACEVYDPRRNLTEDQRAVCDLVEQLAARPWRTT